MLQPGRHKAHYWIWTGIHRHAGRDRTFPQSTAACATPPPSSSPPPPAAPGPV